MKNRINNHSFTFSLAILPLIVTVSASPVRSADSINPGAGHEPLQPWVKRGPILEPGFAPLTGRLVSAPSVVKLDNGRLRLYFWAADGLPEPPAPFPWSGYHRIYAVEADPANPFLWELVSSGPMLGPDPNGTIRTGGVAFPYVLPRNDAPWLMYYGTWGSWGKDGELANRTGLAVSHDKGLTWEVRKEVVLPLGEPGSHDSVLTGSVDVKRIDHSKYMMWYTAGEQYQSIGKEEKRGIVHIGLAHSGDGIDWDKEEHPVLSPRLDKTTPFEAVVSKPSILKINDTYHMWLSVYSMNDTGYRIEYARSTDGVNWKRFPGRPVMTLTPDGFDSRNQSYPNVIDMGDQLWMFYVGNDFGVTGIGFATMDKADLD